MELGEEGVPRGVGAVAHQAQAESERAEAMAVRIDAALDRMPGKWADGVHVPDFSRPDPAEADRPDPFERLAKEAQGG